METARSDSHGLLEEAGDRSPPAVWWLLFDATGRGRVADDWCADLSEEVVTQLPDQAFALSASDVVGWLCATVPASWGVVDAMPIAAPERFAQP